MTLPSRELPYRVLTSVPFVNVRVNATPAVVVPPPGYSPGVAEGPWKYLAAAAGAATGYMREMYMGYEGDAHLVNEGELGKV